jgi:hypothetical protein
MVAPGAVVVMTMRFLRCGAGILAVVAQLREGLISSPGT